MYVLCYANIQHGRSKNKHRSPDTPTLSRKTMTCISSCLVWLLVGCIVALGHADDERVDHVKEFEYQPHSGIGDYLSSHIMENRDKLDEIAEDLRNGKVVVIEDAFPEEMADRMYREIYHARYKLHEDYLDDGFHYVHHNVYDRADFTTFMNETLAMLDSEASKAFMSELTGRDCDGETIATASHYQPGDHSLPHTDHLGQRTVAFVWHLSMRWRPEWGGALYWCPEHNEHAYVHASYNTLTLFDVNEESAHFVTTVSRHAKRKRLAFNGWYHSAWEPNVDDPLEDLIATELQRSRLTYDQYEDIKEIIEEEWLDNDRHQAVEPLYQNLLDEWFFDPIYKREH